MKLDDAALGILARMICGDAPHNTSFPYRSESYLTTFFDQLYLNYGHDGSSRYWRVRSVLTQLNDLPQVSEGFPSAELVRVIEYLVDPVHFAREGGPKQHEAIQSINEVLRRYELVIQRDEHTGKVELCTATGDFVSTAVTRHEAQRTITFSPAVFSVPKNDPDPQQVAVMMPFAAEFTPVYEAIRGACKDADLTCYRSDDIWEQSTFIQDIFDLIFLSSIVIVDFTGRNSNVMYETGIAHTLGKNLVPVTQHLEDIPSDLKPHRALKYLMNTEGLRDLRAQLAKRLRTLRDKQVS